MWRIFNKVIRTGILTEPAPAPEATWMQPEVRAIRQELLHILGRSLAIRAVDAGSCNGCELEIHATHNPYYNLEKWGFQFVASPRHADLLLVTGPVSRNMETALRHTYDAMPAPRRVVALGECACTGGIFGESYASCGPVSRVIPVDVQVPGCPPAPLEILRGIFTAVQYSQGK